MWARTQTARLQLQTKRDGGLAPTGDQKHCGKFPELVPEYRIVQSLLPIAVWSQVSSKELD